MDVNTAAWRKSSHSGGTGGECVELASTPETIAIRDSKDPNGPKLLMGRHEFTALLASLKH